MGNSGWEGCTCSVFGLGIQPICYSLTFILASGGLTKKEAMIFEAWELDNRIEGEDGGRSVNKEKVDVKGNISLWTPLMRVSAVTGNADVASLLVKAGADVNMRDKDGKTPLMVAALNNHEELVQLLSEKGADHQIKNEYGAGVLDMAKAFGRQIYFKFL